MADELCLQMPDFHVTFRDLLHAVNLRHGTNGFTSLPKEGLLRIFSPWKIRRLRPGSNPRTWVPKASTLPLDLRSRFSYLTYLLVIPEVFGVVFFSYVFKKRFSTGKTYFTYRRPFVPVHFLYCMFSNDANSRTRFTLKFQRAFCWCSMKQNVRNIREYIYWGRTDMWTGNRTIFVVHMIWILYSYLTNFPSYERK